MHINNTYRAHVTLKDFTVFFQSLAAVVLSYPGSQTSPLQLRGSVFLSSHHSAQAGQWGETFCHVCGRLTGQTQEKENLEEENF